MRRREKLWRLGLGLIFAGCALGYAPSSLAQSQSQAASKPEAPVATGSANTRGHENIRGGKSHRFWDKQNDWLFAGVGAARTLDYFSTLNMRRRGRQEIFLTNDAVDNHPAFAAIEASATAVSIGASYLFHRYGHHKLERWTSYVHIGLATAGSVRNYCLKTARATAAPGSP